MSGSFETLDNHSRAELRPLRVPILIDGVFEEARDMIGALSAWSIVSSDPTRHVIVCKRKNGLLSGESEITITCTAPEGIPSTTVNVRSTTAGGVLSRDRANVLEFMVPFHRRVC